MPSKVGKVYMFPIVGDKRGVCVMLIYFLRFYGITVKIPTHFSTLQDVFKQNAKDK